MQPPPSWTGTPEEWTALEAAADRACKDTNDPDHCGERTLYNDRIGANWKRQHTCAMHDALRSNPTVLARLVSRRHARDWYVRQEFRDDTPDGLPCPFDAYD